VKRRDFITLLGGAAAWPLAARAQQERMRRIGVLMSYAADDPAGQARLLAFAQELAQSGWIDGRNVRIDVRWGAVDPERIRSHAAELVALAPDVIVASGSAIVGSLLQATRAVPIVFAQVAEPVGAGFVQSLPRPGGNATGFMLYEYGIGSKWLELLKEIAPGVKQVAFLQALVALSGPGLFGAMQGSASYRRPIGAASMSTFGKAPTWGSSWKAFIKANADRWNIAYLQKTTLPYEDNLLDLDPTVKDSLGFPVIRITADHKDNEKKLGAFIQDKMAQWFMEAGAIAVERGPMGTMGPSTHAYGGTRMGDNRETNVVNRFGFSHEVPNLGVLGASVMGTSGAHNPTLTAQALAWRTAEHLSKNWKTIAN
jgi:ABC transporter substrate binding protein/GMC oxidoreductase